MSAEIACEWCGEFYDREHFKDGRCPDCQREKCSGCEVEFAHDELDEGLCEDCLNPTCPTCQGSGMPSTGPPDVGSCSACGGSGEISARENNDGERPPY